MSHKSRSAQTANEFETYWGGFLRRTKGQSIPQILFYTVHHKSDLWASSCCKISLRRSNWWETKRNTQIFWLKHVKNHGWDDEVKFPIGLLRMCSVQRWERKTTFTSCTPLLDRLGTYPIPRHLAHSRWTTFLKKLSGGRSSCYWHKASHDNTLFSVSFSSSENESQSAIWSETWRARTSWEFWNQHNQVALLISFFVESRDPGKSSDHIRHLSPQCWGLHVQFSLHSKLVSANVVGFHITLEGGCKTEVRNSKQLFTLSWPSNFHKVPFATFLLQGQNETCCSTAVNRKTFRWNSKTLPSLSVPALPSLQCPHRIAIARL